MLVEKGKTVIIKSYGNIYQGVITLVVGTPDDNDNSYVMVKWKHLSYPTQHKFSYFDKANVKVANDEKEALGILLKL